MIAISAYLVDKGFPSSKTGVPFLKGKGNFLFLVHNRASKLVSEKTAKTTLQLSAVIYCYPMFFSPGRPFYI